MDGPGNFFLERVWLAVSPAGLESDVFIRVGAPVLHPAGEWSAPVSLDPIESRIDNIRGMDSWQAVEQAMHHAARRVSYLQESGWRFFWDNVDREEAAAITLFRGLGSWAVLFPRFQPPRSRRWVKCLAHAL